MSMVLCEENNCSVAENSSSEQENIRLTREEGGGGGRPSVNMEHDEKRMRRQIANSNERRRMQSINAGFQSLRQLLPHHEGEKLSKAAILQQTAEYIYALEQEKTRLLSQNCQLKRLLDQQDHGLASSDIATQQAVQQITQTSTITSTPQTPTVVGSTVLAATNNNTTAGNIVTVAKKRKIDAIMTAPTISDSSDEGLGSMSPEPISLLTVNPATRTITTNVSTISITAKDYLEIKNQLELERRQKARYEERIRSLERQLYPTRVPYDHQEIIDHTENVEEVAVSIIQKTSTPTITAKIQSRPEIIDHHHHHQQQQQPQQQQPQQQQVQVIHLDGKQHQVVMCTAAEIIESNAELLSETKDEKVYINRSRSKSPVTETVTVQLPPKKCRIPSLLEAAIKAEPKVEVERIASPAAITVKEQQSRSYMTNTCRQNLETIVEAIKHLEGDVFSDSPSLQQHHQPQHVVQDAPLALTTNKQQIIQKDHRQLQMDIQPFLKFRNAQSVSQPTSIIAVSIGTNPQTTSCHQTTSQQQQQQQSASQLLQQQCRPGVIVVKQNS